MRLWTVHEPRNPASALERADQTVFVKDGFSWPGLILTLPWLLVHRLWLGTLIYLGVAAAAAAADFFLSIHDDAGMVLGLLANLYVGFEGNDLRRRKLARRGLVQVGSVLAKSRSEAELIFFSGNAPQDMDAPAPVAARPRPVSVPLNPGAGDEVLGLFPRPEGTR